MATKKRPREIKPAPPCGASAKPVILEFTVGKGRTVNIRPTELSGVRTRSFRAPQFRGLALLLFLDPFDEERLNWNLLFGSKTARSYTHPAVRR